MAKSEPKDPQQLVQSLQRRLWIERAVGLLILTTIAALYLGAIPGGRRAVLISANGEPITVVASRPQANALLDRLQESSGFPPDRVEFAEKLTFHGVSAARNPIATEHEALKALDQKLTLIVQGAAILVGGEVLIALPDQQEAVRTLSMLLKEFAPPGENMTVYFKERVKVDVRKVSPDKLYPSAEEAVAKIVEATAPKKEYLVKPGDSAWKIARDNDITVARLQNANLNVDFERLPIGAKLRIPGELPPLTIIARRDIEEPLPGGRKKKIRITYENRVEIKRDLISRSAPPPGALYPNPAVPQPETSPRAEAPSGTSTEEQSDDPYRWKDEISE